MPVKQMHETKADLMREENVAFWFAERWNLTAAKIPNTYVLDYTFHLGDPRSTDIRFYAEIRTRTCQFGQYPDVFVNMKKLQQADWLRTQGLKTLLLTSFGCGTMAYTELIRPSGFRVAGRNQKNMRNDEDVEPLCYFNIDRFEVVNERKKSNS